jgi:hypothetical protein
VRADPPSCHPEEEKADRNFTHKMLELPCDTFAINIGIISLLILYIVHVLYYRK